MAVYFRNGWQVSPEYAENVELNLDRYRHGDFNFLRIDLDSYFEIDHEIDEALLAKIDCDSSNHREVENCVTIYKAMNELSLYLARDERIWMFLVHTQLLGYSRKRWPIPEDDSKAIQHIRNHFFVTGARGFERDNAASRLWWMASLCSRAGGLVMRDALTCLLYQYDVRANIIERPTTAQNTAIFSTVLKKLHESYCGNRSLFERDRFREIMKQLNLRGGIKLLDVLDNQRLSIIVDECLA